MEFLIIDNKGIESLTVEDFSGLGSLRWIDLNHNHLSALPAGVFSGLTRSLKWLNIDHSLSKKDKDRIRKKLPHTKIRFIR